MEAGQVEDTFVVPNDSPSMSYGQMIDVLVTLYGVREHERARFAARVNKVQRAGVPIGTNKGKGARVRYDLDQFFQMLVVLELAELSISLNNAAAMVRLWWPDSPASLAPAHAWLGFKNGDTNSVLLLASASELEGFAEHRSREAAERAAAARFMVGAPARPYDGLGVVTAERLIRDGRFDLSATSLTPPVWRTSIVDMSTLVPLVERILREKSLVADEVFTGWAMAMCEQFEQQSRAN